MYHEATYDQLRQRRRRRMGILCALLLCLVLAWVAYGRSRELAREQGAASVRESVMRAALQCCAIEGSFPTSLTHLEEHYGLIVNEQDYRISYEWLGDNVPPSVVVVAL